jgi:prepilin-type N-terminal cleavage/methylation domain-containing protein
MQKNKGFTLVELLVVIAIISILVLIVIVAVNPVRVLQDTRDARNRSELLQLKNALQLYLNDENEYPPGAGVGALGVLVPDYARVLPDVTTQAGFAYQGTGTDYDAVVDMTHVTGEDGDSVTKCTTDGDLSGGANANSFMICPD